MTGRTPAELALQIGPALYQLYRAVYVMTFSPSG